MSTILLVEPVKTMRDEAKAWLESAGYDVVVTDRGGEVLPIMQSRHIDAVSTAIFIEDLDGLIVIKRIRAKFPHMPVLVVSDSGRFVQYDVCGVAVHLGADMAQETYQKQEYLAAVAKLLGPKTVSC